MHREASLKKCAEESFDCVSCGCCSRCPAGISHPMVGLLARRLNGKYIAPKSEHVKKRVEEIHEGKYDDLIEQIMQKPIKKCRNFTTTEKLRNKEGVNVCTISRKYEGIHQKGRSYKSTENGNRAKTSDS